MLCNESRNEVIHFPLPACDGHAAIIGEQKAKKQVGSIDRHDSAWDEVLVWGRAPSPVPVAQTYQPAVAGL